MVVVQVVMTRCPGIHFIRDVFVRFCLHVKTYVSYSSAILLHFCFLFVFRILLSLNSLPSAEHSGKSASGP